MNKNKKVLLIIITLLLTTTLFTRKVSATYMYLDCAYNEEYNDKFNRFVRLTDGSGSKVKGIGQFFQLKDNWQIPNTDGCWIPDITKGNENCKDEWRKSGQVEEKILSGVCPAGIRSAKDNAKMFVPIGEGRINESSELKDDEYIFYYLENSKGQKIVYGEGYNQDGLYANINTISGDNVAKYQLQYIVGKFDKGLYKNNLLSLAIFTIWGIPVQNSTLFGTTTVEAQWGDFWKVSTNRKAIFPNYICAVYGYDSENYKEGDCYTYLEKEKGIKFGLIVDSKDSNSVLKNTAKEWYEQEMKNFENTSNSYGELKKKEKLIDESAKIRKSVESGTSYSFPDNYRPQEMFEDLKDAYNNLKNMEDYNFTDYSKCYTGTNKEITPPASLYTYAWTNIFSLDENSMVCDSKDLNEYYSNKFYSNKFDITDSVEKRSLNSGILDSIFYNSLNKALKEIAPNSEDVLNIDKMIKEYIRDFTIMISYIDSNYRDLLTSEQVKELDTWRAKYEKYASENNIVTVVDCAGLLGQNLIDKINSYLNIIKIAVPIILIALGIVEFSKAVFAGQEDQMKKAQKNFIKRLIIAIIIFFVPTIVNLILQLANKVWPIIESSSCKIG